MSAGRAYGVQFQFEVTNEMAAEGLACLRMGLSQARARAGVGSTGCSRTSVRIVGQMRADARVLFSRWVDLWAPATGPLLSARR